MGVSSFSPQPGFATQGAASLTEGQRLVARRRGPVRRWVREHPLVVSWTLIIIHLLNQAINLFFLSVYEANTTPAPTSHFWVQAALIAVGSLVFSVVIYYRTRLTLLWLVVSVVCDLAIVFIFGPSSSMSGFAVWVLLYTVAVERNLKTVITTYVFLGIASLLMSLPLISPRWRAKIAPQGASELTTTGVWWLFISSTLLVLAVHLTIVVIGRSVRRNRVFEQEILRHFEQTQALAATEERNRIAREMHDVVAHSLTVMITLSDGARLVGQKNPERAGEVLQELSSTGRNALADMRRTLGVLREDTSGAQLTPAEGISEDAVENLRALAESFSSTGLNVEFIHEGAAVPEDNNLRLSLYRIVQESLTNALRYGQDAQNISVRLSVSLPDIFITVINDGSTLSDSTSLPPSIGTGKGITGMRERAAFYNGTVNVGPNDVGGWTVRAHLKWDAGTKGEV